MIPALQLRKREVGMLRGTLICSILLAVLAIRIQAGLMESCQNIEGLGERLVLSKCVRTVNHGTRTNLNDKCQMLGKQTWQIDRALCELYLLV